MNNFDYKTIDGGWYLEKFEDLVYDTRYLQLLAEWNAMSKDDYLRACDLHELIRELHQKASSGEIEQINDGEFFVEEIDLNRKNSEDLFIFYMLFGWKDGQYKPLFSVNRVDYSGYIPEELKPYAQKVQLILEIKNLDAYIKSLPPLNAHRFKEADEEDMISYKINEIAKSLGEKEKLEQEALKLFARGCVDTWPTEPYNDVTGLFEKPMTDQLLDIMVDWLNDAGLINDEWGSIAENYVLTEAFIRKNIKDIPRDFLLNQTLSEALIHDLRNDLDWYYVVISQSFTRDFMKAHIADIVNGNKTGDEDMLNRMHETFDSNRSDYSVKELNDDPTIITCEDIDEAEMLL